MTLDHSLIGVSSSPDIREWQKAMNLAQAQYKAIAKSGFLATDSAGEGVGIATLTDICEALLPALLANGFSMPLYRPSLSPHGWIMTAQVTHAESGQWVSGICPLFLERQDMRTFEGACTMASKILFRALCGGWLKRDGEQEPEVQEEPKAEEPKAEPAKGQPKPVAKPFSIIERAEARLKLKAEEGNLADIQKIFDHLDLLIEGKEVTKAEVEKLRKKYAAKTKEVASA